MTMIVALLFLAAQPSPAAHPAQPTHPPTSKVELRATEVTVPLSFMGNRPIVEVTINGAGPYRMILDTGAQGSVLDSGLADELGLPVLGEAQLGSPAGGEPVASKIVGFDGISLGDAVITGGTMVAVGLKGFFERADGPRGVLSAALFEEYLTTLDYPGRRLVIRSGSLPEPDGVEVIPYQDISGLPALPVVLAGRTFMVHMDTGSPHALVLPAKYADELPLASPPVEAGRARTVDREMVIRVAPVDGTLTLGRLTIGRPDISFMDLPGVGNVGFELLGRFAITIDRKNRRVRLDGPALGVGAPKAHPPRRYGIGLRGAGDGVPEVALVASGSPAEEAGVRVGDRVLRIGGTSVASLSSDDIAAAMRAPHVTLTVQRGGETIEIAMSLEP